MNVIIKDIIIECFENEREYKLFLDDNKNNLQLIKSTIYFGRLYDITETIKASYLNLIAEIKRNCYSDVQFVVIHKK